MSFQILPKARVDEWINELRTRQRVVAPTRVDGSYVFAETRPGQSIPLDYPTSLLPPKRVVLPPREELLRFQDGKIEAQLEEASIVLLGAHTCDLHAMALLDRVYGEGVPDQHYQARRRGTTMVSIECLRPCTEHAFCKSMGTLTLPETFDLHLTDLGEDYAVDVGSEKGAALLEGFAGAQAGTSGDRGRTMPFGYTLGPAQLDCYDETINTSNFLGLLGRDGLLRYHREGTPVQRTLIDGDIIHATAVVAETATGRRFAVDSSYFDNGVAASVAPVEDWLSGWKPPEIVAAEAAKD